MAKSEAGSILDMVQGGVRERVNIEFAKIINNIMDPNTEAKKKRVINLKIEFAPDGERKTIAVNYHADSKLAPMHPIATAVCITTDKATGAVGAVEMTPQIPGQVDLEGSEQKPGKVISVKQALAN